MFYMNLFRNNTVKAEFSVKIFSFEILFNVIRFLNSNKFDILYDFEKLKD